MVIINLLPWRDDLRVFQQRKVVKIILLTLLLNILFVACLHVILTRQCHQLEIANHILNSKIKKAGGIHHQHSHMNQPTIPLSIIDNVVSYLDVTNKLMTNLSQIKSESICFSEVSRHEHQITFNGYANSDIDLAVYLKAWRQSSLFSEMMINKIELQVNGTLYFQITAYEISSVSHARLYARDAIAKSEIDDDPTLSL